MTKSLWPDNIGISNREMAPVSILREQATFLGQKTQNLVIAIESMLIQSDAGIPVEPIPNVASPIG